MFDFTFPQFLLSKSSINTIMQSLHGKSAYTEAIFLLIHHEVSLKFFTDQAWEYWQLNDAFSLHYINIAAMSLPSFDELKKSTEMKAIKSFIGRFQDITRMTCLKSLLNSFPFRRLFQLAIPEIIIVCMHCPLKTNIIDIIRKLN